MRREALAHGLLLLVVATWGVTFVLVKGALAQSTPILFVVCRMALAAAVLALFYGRLLRKATLAPCGWGAMAGVCLGAGYCLQTAGLQWTTPSRSAFVTGAVVLLVPFLSLVPAVRVPGTGAPRPLAFVGAAVGFAGLVLLTAQRASPGAGAGAATGFGRGEALTLGCALAYALHLLTLARASPRMHYGVLAVLQIGFAAVTALVLLPVFEPRAHLRASPRLLVALGVASVLATAAAFLIQTWAQRFLPATHTALLLTLEPVFAAATSCVVLGERLGGPALLGAALVLGGILLAELSASGIQATAHETAPPAGMCP